GEARPLRHQPAAEELARRLLEDVAVGGEQGEAGHLGTGDAAGELEAGADAADDAREGGAAVGQDLLAEARLQAAQPRRVLERAAAVLVEDRQRVSLRLISGKQLHR